MMAGLGMGLLVSCTDEVPEVPSSELYTRAWVKQFGAIDKRQDWNNATRGSVTVDVAGTSDVTITTKIDGVNYLLAKYDNVSGNNVLNFDVPRGVQEVTVRSGMQSLRTTLGATADFTDPNSLGDIHENGINITKQDYLITTGDEPIHYRDKLPEGENNLGKVPGNFVFTSNGSFIVYPIYWNTSETDEIGVYTVNPDGSKNHYPILQNKTDDLQYCSNLGGPAPHTYKYKMTAETSWQWGNWVKGKTDPMEYTSEDWGLFWQEFLSYVDGMNEWDYRYFVQQFGLASNDKIEELKIVSKPGDEGNDGTYVEIAGYTGETWMSTTGNESYDESTADGYLAWRSMGYKIDIDDGIQFGMYIKRLSDNLIFYSNADWNPNNIPHAATYIHHCGTGSMYREFRVLAFEDWPGQTEPDLNDVVLYIASDNVHEIPDLEEIDAKPIKWLIAAEDLGAMDDFDFNDVVFEVEHVAGQLQATIRPLAAGGTLETYLMRDGEKVNALEWHALFGHDINTMVNTGRATGKAKSFTIDVPADFTLTSSNRDASGNASHEAYRNNMGGFYLEVVREDGKVSTVEAPGAGEAAQMIMIFQKEDKKWCWPTERINIKTAYPRFVEWSNPENGFLLEEEGENWFDTVGSMVNAVFQR